jgi:glycosyltransferase involved in cell wall biosynthesis
MVHALSERTARLPGLSLVMPAHNERENLEWLLPHVARVLPEIAERFEVILVDDGSTDGSGELATSLATDLGIDLKVVRHAQKSGYGISVGDGLREAGLDYAAFLDADGQLDPADLARLVPLLDQFDMVAGYRMTREDPAFRSVISGVFNRLVLITFRLSIRDVNCALKVIRTDVLRRFRLEARSALINAELYAKVRAYGGRFTQVPVPHHPRRLGRRSGGRLIPILRAMKELVVLRSRLRKPSLGRD